MSTNLPHSNASLSVGLWMTSVMVVAWIIGSLGLSIAWIIVLVIFTWIVHQEAVRRQSMANHVFLTTALQDKTVFMRLIQDIPDWIKFPEFERATWLNDLIALSWEQLRNTLEASILWGLQPIVSQDMGTLIPKLNLTRFDFGPTPPVVTAVAAYPPRSSTPSASMGRLSGLDISLVYGGQSLIILTASGMEIRIEDVHISGRIRLMFSPLIVGWPCFSAVSVSFLERPKVTFKIKLSFEKKQRGLPVPVVHQFISKMIDDAVSDYLLWPNKFDWPLFETSESDLSAQKVGAQGTVSIRILEALDVPKAQDIYCIVQNNSLKSAKSKGKSSEVLRTKTSPVIAVNSGLTSVVDYKVTWREDFQIDVYNDMSDVVDIFLYSVRKLGGDKLLDRCSIVVSELKMNETSDIFYLLNESGARLHLNVCYSTLQKPSQKPSQPAISLNDSDEESCDEFPENHHKVFDSKRSLKQFISKGASDFKRILSTRQGEGNEAIADSELSEHEEKSISIVESIVPVDAILEILHLEIKDIPKSVTGMGNFEPYIVIKLLKSDVSRRLAPQNGLCPVWSGITLQIQEHQMEEIHFTLFDTRRLILSDREIAFAKIVVNSLLVGNKQECTVQFCMIQESSPIRLPGRRTSVFFPESNAATLLLKYKLTLLDASKAENVPAGLEKPAMVKDVIQIDEKSKDSRNKPSGENVSPANSPASDKYLSTGSIDVKQELIESPSSTSTMLSIFPQPFRNAARRRSLLYVEKGFVYVDVKRVENVVHDVDSEFWVEFCVGNESVRTRRVKGRKDMEWNETLTMSRYRTIDICVKGIMESKTVEIGKGKTDCINGTKEIELHPQGRLFLVIRGQ